MIALLMDWLFPPIICGTNSRMKALLCAHPLPPPRARAVEPMTAVEREEAEALERNAESIGREAEGWLRRR